MELGVGEEGGGDPLRLPVVAVVDCDDGAGAPLQDKKVLGALVADEIIATLEGEFLMAPEEVFRPRSSGNSTGGGSVAIGGKVPKEIFVEELRIAVDGNGECVGECGTGIVGVEGGSKALRG